MTQEYEVIFYDQPDGSEPAKEFLNSLDVKMRAKMVKEIELLAVNGPELREPYSKAIGDNIRASGKSRNGYFPRIIFFLRGAQNYTDKRFYQENKQDSAEGKGEGKKIPH